MSHIFLKSFIVYFKRTQLLFHSYLSYIYFSCVYDVALFIFLVEGTKLCHDIIESSGHQSSVGSVDTGVGMVFHHSNGRAREFTRRSLDIKGKEHRPPSAKSWFFRHLLRIFYKCPILIHSDNACEALKCLLLNLEHGSILIGLLHRLFLLLVFWHSYIHQHILKLLSDCFHIKRFRISKES